MQKIITHDGLFHADEVFAISLLMTTRYLVPIVRTREITMEDLNNPDIWILDVGGMYSDIKNCFDHHQDSSLPATNVLVLDHLYCREFISKELFELLLPAFTEISNIDKGGWDGMNGFQVNSLIKSFNFVENGWELALNVATAYIKSCISKVNEDKKSIQIWEDGMDIIPGGFSYSIGKICDDYPVNWKNQALYPEVFLITPKWNKKQMQDHLYDGTQEYKLLTVDSKLNPIYSNGTEKFLHNAGFIAIYKTLDEAIEAVNFSYTKQMIKDAKFYMAQEVLDNPENYGLM